MFLLLFNGAREARKLLHLAGVRFDLTGTRTAIPGVTIPVSSPLRSPAHRLKTTRARGSPINAYVTSQSSLQTLERGRGSCGDFAFLFAEAARSLGFGAGS